MSGTKLEYRVLQYAWYIRNLFFIDRHIPLSVVHEELGQKKTFQMDEHLNIHQYNKMVAIKNRRNVFPKIVVAQRALVSKMFSSFVMEIKIHY